MRAISRLLVSALLGSGLRAAEPSATFVISSGPVLTQDDAIRMALRKNKNLEVVSYGKGIARAELLAARGAFDPSLTFNRSTSQTPENINEGSLGPLQFEDVKTDSYSVGLGGVLPVGTNYSITANSVNNRFQFSGYSDEFQSFGGFTVTQPLLKGFGFDANLAGVRIAKANRSISDLAYRQSAMDTVFGVVVSYSNLQLAHDLLGVAERTRALADSLLEDNEKSYKVGSISLSDVIQARSQVATLEEPVLIAQRSVRDAENALRELMGDETFFEEAPLYVLVPVDPVTVTVDRKADLERALSMRPDYQEARVAILKNRAGEAQANNALLPEVDFVGGYGYNGLSPNFTASRQMVSDRLNPSFSAGVAVTIPLTFSVARGNARAARLTRRQSEAQLQQMEADIAVSVAAAIGQIETTRKRVVSDQAAYVLAKQALEAEEKKKRAGASSTLAVVQVQQQLALVEGNLYGALANERQAVATYDHELGMSLERNHIRLSGD